MSENLPPKSFSGLAPYQSSLAGSLLAAREAVMAPIRPYLREANMTEQQWRVLRVLAEAKNLDAKSIADKALLHAASVTRILKELEERQLIERQIDKSDGRRWIVSITPVGGQKVRDTAKHIKLLLKGYSAAFGRDRLEAFKVEAQALAEALSIGFSPDE
ncbi:MarR family transcriptional regulator [Sphingobium sp. H39-3-25]|uniref:MarR family transcriptional regulator n=1 Tax=Sphingobium arseniciresistens TaxID=3030834 RepID=UPI0023B8A586|nr:MarR family transcriptional regulator [Sphingobium arseniciresistens]